MFTVAGGKGCSASSRALRETLRLAGAYIKGEAREEAERQRHQLSGKARKAAGRG